MQGGSIIKNVDNWVSWVLRKFLGLTDDEMEYFMGDRDAGRTPEKKALKDMTESAEEKEARQDFERAAATADAEGKLEPYKKRIKLVQEAHKVLTDPDDVDEDGWFSPLPSKEQVEEWKAIAEKEEDKGVYDLEDEERQLMEALGQRGNGGIPLPCPACREGHLQTKYDALEEKAFLICSRIGTCGFVAYAEGEEVVGGSNPSRD
jgi:hypothetical protein